jgi:hypothetical protein
LFNEPTTPANKKKKKNPKTPYPDPDLDSSDEDSDHQGLRLADEIEALANPVSEEDPYRIQTQAPAGLSWDEMETPEADPTAYFLQDSNRLQGAFIEEVEGDEFEVATQLSGSGLHVEDVTSPSVTSPSP